MGRKGVSKRKSKAKSRPFSAANISGGVASTNERPAENMPEISVSRGKGAPISQSGTNQRRTTNNTSQKGNRQ
jgi:hypothetical protein